MRLEIKLLDPVYINFDLYCDECGRILTATKDGSEGIHIRVKPCVHCLNDTMVKVSQVQAQTLAMIQDKLMSGTK